MKPVVTVSCLAIVAVLAASATAILQEQRECTDRVATPEPASAPVGEATMGKGYNALNGQSGLQPIFTTTFAKGKTWVSPSGEAHAVADQFSLAEVSSAFTVTVQGLQEGFNVGAQTYFNAYKASAGVSLGNLSFSGSANASLGISHLMQSLSTHTEHGHVKYGLSTYRAIEFQLNALPAFVLNATSNFTASVLALPETATAPGDLARYQNFISTFGTHYVCRGQYGGEIAEFALLAEETVEDYGIWKCKNSMTLSFHQSYHNVSAGLHEKAKDIDLDKWYLNSVINITQWKGGEKSLRGNKTALGAWVNSIPDNADLVGATLCSLGDFMVAAKKSTFESVVDQILGKSI